LRVSSGSKKSKGPQTISVVKVRGPQVLFRGTADQGWSSQNRGVGTTCWASQET